MPPGFASVFSCCGSRKKRKSSAGIVDEESRLIPSIPEDADHTSPVIPDLVVVDHQKLRDRLGDIVRNAEGKMVNVTSQHPFNLRTDPHLQPSTHPNVQEYSTSSRSNSRYYSGPAAATTSSLSHGHSTQSQQGTPVSSRGPSMSRGSSSDFNDSAGEEGAGRRVLNARLVTGLRRRDNERGRTKGRARESVEKVLGEETSKGKAPVGLGIDLSGEHATSRLGSEDSPQETTPSATTFPNTSFEPSPSSPNISEPTDTPRPKAEVPFKLRDPGAIVLGWGD